ncbi:MAG: histidine kinase [Oscillospiraceae bacterium]|nr:histidine kinase [Oscillospiraceae bacterium]
MAGRQRRKSIRSKLFLTYAAVLSIIVLVFAGVLFTVLIRTYSDAMRNNQVELTSQMISKVDSFFSEMDTIALVAAGNPRLLAYFIDLSEGNGPGNYFEQNLIDGVDAGSLLTNINGRSHTADRISVYNESSDYISTGILYETKKKSGNGHALPISEWLEEMKYCQHLVIGAHQDFWSDLSEPLISVIRPLSNDYGNASYGIVEVQRRFSRLEALLSFETDQGLIMVIFDESGVPLYATDPGWRDTGEYGRRIAQSSPVGIQTLSEPSNRFAVYGQSSIAQWNIMLLYNQNALYQTYYPSFIVLACGTLLLLIVLVMIVYFIADRFSRPIRKLSASIQNIDLQNLRLEFSDLGKDEVDDIQRAFETFASRLSQSSSMEMEAQMFALQSQINPHFLYNTLAVISAAGYEGGNEKVTDICAALSSMLRYAASNSAPNGSSITLNDELAHMRAYLDLMRKRYEEDFEYEIAVNGDPTRVKAPKLILQPIVENCFQHGFKGVAPPWHIWATLEITDSRWTVTIADNGVGMSAQAVNEMQRRLDDFKRSKKFPKLSPGGSGMLNTAVRLYLSYGDEGIFMVEDRKANGTVIKNGAFIMSGTVVVIGGNI